MMPNSLFTPTLTSSPTHPDIFAKYLNGPPLDQMPFKLYNSSPDHNPKKPRRRSIRGPYRKYSIDQKRDIIDRILNGATLKSISEQTEIPKRNLIRWKHQFLQKKFSDSSSPHSEELEYSTDTKSLPSHKDLQETKLALSEPNIHPSIQL